MLVSAVTKSLFTVIGEPDLVDIVFSVLIVIVDIKVLLLAVSTTHL